MSELQEKRDDQSGYGTETVGNTGGAPDEDRPEQREPVSDEEARQDNYANTDDQEA